MNRPRLALSVGALLVPALLIALFLVTLDRERVVVEYTASLDGHLDGCSCWGDPIAGLVKRAVRHRQPSQSETLWTEAPWQRVGGAPDLLLDAGNILSPGRDPELSRHILESYGELGYDLVALGNQELSDGVDALRAYLAAYPLGSHNLSLPGAPALGEPLIKRVGELRVAILSLTGEESFDGYPPAFRESFSLEEPLQAARRVLQGGEEPDHLILLYHGNRPGAEGLGLALTGVDAVIYGHEEDLTEVELANGALLLSPGEHGNRVGRLTLRSHRAVLSGDRVEARPKNSFLFFDYGKEPDDPTVRERVAAYEAHREAQLADLTEPESSLEAEGAAASHREAVTVRYYYSPGCKECREFLRVRAPEIEANLSVPVEIRRRNILAPGVYREFESLLSTAGVDREEFPVAVVGERMLQGSPAIDADLDALILAHAEGRSVTLGTPLRSGTPDGPGRVGAGRLSLLPVVAAGLLDGINPCVFTALLFLLSSILLVRKERRELLLVGGIFLGTVYLTYFSAGLGLLAGLRAAEGLPVVSATFRTLLIGALLLLALLSARDAWLARGGKTERMALRLPKGVRERLHGEIRGYRRRGAMVGGTVIVAFLITIFELGCTGQIYLPTLAYYARSSVRALSLLAVYNLAFITPLAALFLAVVAGVSLGGIRKAFSAGLPAVRLLSALLFGSFAAALAFL